MSSTPSTRLPASELLQLRLRSQGLGECGAVDTDRGAATPASAVDRLFALQGQDLPGALWSLGVRAPDSDLADVQAAFDRGELVRTWPFRGTLFVIAAADVPWVLALTAERSIRGAARRREQLGLDEATFDAAEAVARDVLSGGGLTRQPLLDAFAAGGIAVDASRGYHMIWTLAQRGVIVLGPFEGREQRFVLADEWITAPRRLEADEALGELVRRYLAGRGPTPESDIAWWTKLPLRDVRRGIDVVRGELVGFDVAGVHHWAHAATLDRVASENPPATILLPGFDEWMLGHGDRDPVVDPEHAQQVVPGNNGIFKSTVVHRGRVVGLWSKRTLTRRTVLTPTALEGTLSKTVRAGVARAADRYGRFLGTEIEVADGR
ncbi:MAG: winged helix DNA-binding domain-containing protein [Patulibacter sp.]